MKRTIQYVCKRQKGYRTYTNTIRLHPVSTKLYKKMLQLDGLSVDVAVTLDRWGRLKVVQLERSPLDWI